MRCILRSLLSLVFCGALATCGWAGAIPSPFAEPETSRTPAAKQRPAAQTLGDDIIKPSELPPAGGGAIETIQRESLAPLDAPAAPAGAALQPPALASPPAGAEPVRSAPDAGADPASTSAAPNPPSNYPSVYNDRSGEVARGDLAPVMAQDGTGLPYELWQGMTIEEVEKAIATLEIPPRSPALQGLFRKLITSNVPPPQGGVNDVRFTAIRVEALDRSGFIDEAAALLSERVAMPVNDPVLSVLAARTAIARGDRDAGCRNVQAINAGKSALPAGLKGQSILVRAYCAIASDQKESAELQVALARDEGVAESAGLSAIDAISAGSKPTLAKGQKAGPVDWRILELGGATDPTGLIETASPGLLTILARDPSIDPALRLAALERAAQLNAGRFQDLAAAYRAFGGGAPGAEGAAGQATRHAALFQAAQDEATPLKKARLIRSFLDEMRTAGLYWPALQMMAPAAAAVPRVPEIGWFTETAIEMGLASGDFGSVRTWAEFGGTLDGLQAGPQSYAHWLALADVVDPALTDGRGRHLDALQDQAARGRFTPEQLHRVVTVLDALQIQVPIPLWDLASRTPQPDTGHLPETGVLSALSAAAKKREFGHTVLLTMQSVGPNGAEGAHIIALGDSIRALRSAGLDSDARALALEALFMSWPRVTG
ncbi:MAG: hypothetical protein MUC37_00680 [Hyphomicrobium sp.]|nr:hypothetical protein [Hyphomicrobium sp.]